MNKYPVGTDIERGALLYPIKLEMIDKKSPDLVLYALTDCKRTILAGHLAQPRNDFPMKIFPKETMNETISLRKALRLRIPRTNSMFVPHDELPMNATHLTMFR